MNLNNIVDEDFINYKKPSMFLVMPHCTFKCGKENCQNYKIANLPTIKISETAIIQRYLENPITKAIVFGGLEPFDSEMELYDFIQRFRQKSNDDIVIYTGYTKDEVIDKFNWIFSHHNIIIKYGRYIANDISHYDEILGVKLASSNQYAERYD